MNMYAKFQLRPPYGFWEEDFLNVFFFSENLAFQLPWSPIKISDLDKIHMVEDYSRNISVKLLSKYLQ